MNNTIYVVSLEDGLISSFKLEDFIMHFNHNEFFAHNYNAYLNKENAEEERAKILKENAKE